MKKMLAKQLWKLVEPKTNSTEEVTTEKWLIGSITVPNDKK